jgi:hypothetical protein
MITLSQSETKELHIHRHVKNVSEDQPREPNGEFGSGGKIVHEGHDAILKEAGYTQTDKKGQYKDAEGNKVQVSKNGAFTATSKTYQMKVGTTANDLKAAISMTKRSELSTIETVKGGCK